MVPIDADPVGVEAVLGFRFTRRDLLTRALTHSSQRGETGGEPVPDSDNEQLEFLGDAVLGLVVSEFVLRFCPDFDEGRLSNVKSRLVNRVHLADVARSLGLGRHLLMGRGEERSGGRDKTSLLANALEAILGAVYLDGGLDAASAVVLSHVIGAADIRSLASDVNNLKTTLEVLAKSKDLPRPEYSVRAENAGFPQMFVADVRVGKALSAEGRGSSKKLAEMEAARAMLARLQTSPADR